MIIACVIIGIVVVVGGLAVLGMSPQKTAPMPPLPARSPQAQPVVQAGPANQANRANHASQANQAGQAGQPGLQTLGKQQPPPPVDETFVCRVMLHTEQSKSGPVQSFCVEIKGGVVAPSDNHATRCRINVDDVSEQSAQPLRSTVARYQSAGGIFLYEEPNGRLPRAKTVISDWMAVATLPVAMFSFSRKGTRKLLFRVALISCETGESLAAAKLVVAYDNTELGYEDGELNIAKSQQYGVTLALAMAIADDKVAESELDVIRRWAAARLSEASGGELVPDAQLQKQLEKALQQALKFFSSGGRIDIRALCSEVVSLVPETERMELMRLCVSVARADAEVCEREMDMLNRFSLWLVLDRSKVRQMFEQLIPADACAFSNPDVALGITGDMDPELIRKYLNEEYRRWNSRVTNSDPAVRQRAETVMGMIADARRRYVREQSPTALHTLTTPRPGNN
jgi:hypothetical protein